VKIGVSIEFQIANRSEPVEREAQHWAKIPRRTFAFVAERASAWPQCVIFYDEEWSEEIKILAGRLVGQTPNPELRALANRFAEAQIDLSRIRAIKHRILEQLLSKNEETIFQRLFRSSEADLHALKGLMKVDRYEKRALSRRRSATRDLVRTSGLNVQNLAERTQKPFTDASGKPFLT
jgi:hypothetical protein